MIKTSHVSEDLLGPRHLAPKERTALGRTALGKGLFATMPIVLASTIAMSLNLTGPIDSASALKRPAKDKSASADLAKTIRHALAIAGAQAANPEATMPGTVTAAASVPTIYRVGAGDTVSSIAARHGLSTASVLALNGLGWKSIIFPGQILKLVNGPTPIVITPKSSPAASNGRYIIVSGDTVSKIAGKFGVPVQSILSANGLGWSSIIYPGQTLAIPGQSATASMPAVVITPVADTPAPVVQTPVVETHAATTSATVSNSYTIKPGDTVSKIAAKFGVDVQSILNANGLGWSSIIYTGRTLSIPGVTIAASTTGVLLLSDEMSRNASTIIQVGKSLGVSEYGLVVSLAAAMQESGLRNLTYGDRDSIGLFQQRPSAGWGTPGQILNPVHAAKLFFGGPSNPNPGITRGLLDIPGWQSMTVTQAAQAVQISAFPNAYARWETSARSWLAHLG